MTKLYFPQEEYEHRWQSVYDQMDRLGYETAVIWGRTGGTYEQSGNMVYLTNYYSTASGNAHSAVIFNRGEAPELHMDMPSYDMSLLATDRAVGHDSQGIFQGVSNALREKNITGRVALVGSNFLPLGPGKQIEDSTPGIDWGYEDQLLAPVREIKSPLELDCYRHAGQIASHALNRLIEGLILCKTEAEAAADAAYEVTRAGGRFHMMPVSHGDTIENFARLPLAGFSEDAPKTGELVRGWVYGPMYQGYWLDPGRTAIAGPLKISGSSEQRGLIEATAGIVSAIIDAIEPGVKVDDVVELGERMLQAAGGVRDQAGEMFPIYGHGVGQSWEGPTMRVGQQTDQVFKEGMTLGIEAFMAHPGVGSAGFEQNVIVTADGTELLTTTPMLWW